MGCDGDLESERSSIEHPRGVDEPSLSDGALEGDSDWGRDSEGGFLGMTESQYHPHIRATSAGLDGEDNGSQSTHVSPRTPCPVRHRGKRGSPGITASANASKLAAHESCTPARPKVGKDQGCGSDAVELLSGTTVSSLFQAKKCEDERVLASVTVLEFVEAEQQRRREYNGKARGILEFIKLQRDRSIARLERARRARMRIEELGQHYEKEVARVSSRRASLEKEVPHLVHMLEESDHMETSFFFRAAVEAARSAAESWMEASTAYIETTSSSLLQLKRTCNVAGSKEKKIAGLVVEHSQQGEELIEAMSDLHNWQLQADRVNADDLVNCWSISPKGQLA